MKIKNLIEYYYNIKIDNLYRSNKKYQFIYNNAKYLFLPLTRYEREIIEINHLTKNNERYDQIIMNIENKLITFANNRYYILIKEIPREYEISKILLNPFYVLLPKSNFDNIDRSNWVFLWSEKIDYVEYQQFHLIKDYPLLRNSINYFIGMGETAISYIYNIYHSTKSDNEKLVIAHKRIKKEEFNNPLNLIVDHQSRDVAEYLKYLFYHNTYDYIKIKKLINELNLDLYSSQLVYGRMFFPTYYFDIYDSIINKSVEEKEILKILKRVDEYEDYLKNIYEIINQNVNIERVDWL